MWSNWVYLIHFERHYHHAQHYIGATNDLTRRLSQHAAGDGANLIRVIQDAGISWVVARVWIAQNRFIAEVHAKRQKNGPEFCPICNPVQTRILRGCVSYPLTELPQHILTLNDILESQ